MHLNRFGNPFQSEVGIYVNAYFNMSLINYNYTKI